LCAGTYTVTVSDSGGSSGSPFNWNYVITSTNHTILIQTGTVLINGVAISTGDYLGVFYTSGSNVYCGGYSIWTGSTIAVGAWGDDSGTPEKDGFSSNEEFIWKAWHATGSGTGVVVNMTATYQSGYPNQGNYTTNGMSVIASLTGTSSGGSGQNIVQSYTITQPSALSLSIAGVNVTTYGGTNGSANLTVSGGTTPYTYHWSNNATTQNISGLIAGTYIVTVTDANNCNSTSSIIITQPSYSGTLSLSGITTNNVCYGACTGSIDITVSGGTTPYSYIWSNGPTTQDLTGLCAGTY
ncbi:MAG: SprB repeat-containing protein, partial [Bacteroidia bacterium]|nr:SprB repeat-containing protein [Bacteroidia bacterium]